MAVKRFGVSIEEDLLFELDKYVEENNFANRSQALRFIIEKNLGEKKWLCNHIVAGVIVLMYDYQDKDVISEIAGIESLNHELILSSSQNYLNSNFCLHIVTVMGEAQKLTKLSDKLISIKGIKHGKLTMSRAD